MRRVEPRVYLIASTAHDGMDAVGFEEYLASIPDAPSWEEVSPGDTSEAEQLVEFGGRLCYRSWAPGLNPNVTRVRTGNAEYLANVIAQRHGSVLEHASFTFLFADVSRVFTHELVRHRAGCAVSQESMRYVRLTDVPMVLPSDTEIDINALVYALERSAFVGGAEEFERQWRSPSSDAENIVAAIERYQARVGRAVDSLSGPGAFERKKKITSFMRRHAPDGVATAILWTANARALRHVIELRTDPSAEEEIRGVFGRVAEIAAERWPGLFGDFERRESGAWVPKTSKA